MLRRSFAARLMPLVVAVAVGQGVATPAHADVVYLDQFSVSLASANLFVDSFDRNATLDGSPAGIVPSGVNFPNGTGANYYVNGTIPESAANGGRARLDTANGLVRAQPDPFLPAIQIVAATLMTGTGMLTPASTFAASAVFDLTAPASALGTYGIFLTNRQTGIGQEGNTVELRLRQCTPGAGGCAGHAGPMLQLMWLDFVHDAAALVDQVALSPADMANGQIELQLSHLAGSDAITATYAFGNGGVFGGLASLGITGNDTDVFTADRQFVRAGFEAFAPVPEPGTLSLLGVALAGLAVARRGKR